MDPYPLFTHQARQLVELSPSTRMAGSKFAVNGFGLVAMYRMSLSSL